MPTVTDCPHCGAKSRIPEGYEGKPVLCPTCKGQFTAPTPDFNPATAPTEERPVLAGSLRAESRRVPAPPPPEDDTDLEHRPVRSGRAAGFRCPRCGSEAPPVQREQISVAGWILFAVLLVMVCPFLCWIGLLMKEPYQACADCGLKLS